MSERKIILAVWQDKPDTPLKLAFDGSKEQIMKIIQALTAGMVEQLVNEGGSLDDIEETILNQIVEYVMEGVKDALTNFEKDDIFNILKEMAKKNRGYDS